MANNDTVYNTGETQEKLRLKYNPEGSNLRKAQMRMLEIMDYIDEVCNELGITYSLDGGNVLGAIRHGGFIPWDDDSDVFMTMSDYRKFCNHLKEHPHPQFVLQNHDTDPMFFEFWSVVRDLKSEYLQDSELHKIRKFRGLQVDIFPLEAGVIPSLKKRSFNMFCKHVFRPVQRREYRKADRAYKFMDKVVLPCFRLVSRLFGDNRQYSFAYGLPWDFRFPKEVIFPVRRVQYEDRILPVPHQPEEYCKIEYGDYASLPPEAERIGHKTQVKIW